MHGIFQRAVKSCLTQSLMRGIFQLAVKSCPFKASLRLDKIGKRCSSRADTVRGSVCLGDLARVEVCGIPGRQMQEVGNRVPGPAAGDESWGEGSRRRSGAAESFWAGYPGFHPPCRRISPWAVFGLSLRDAGRGKHYLTRQSGGVSKAVHPKRWKRRRGREQQPRPRVPSLPLRFQRIRPREPVQLRNVDLLRRNAIYVGSPAVSAMGTARLR
jgi:hypothetical protein